MFNWPRDLKPGDMVLLSNGTKLLIGDVNPLGGVCDDCHVLTDRTITVISIQRRQQ